MKMFDCFPIFCINSAMDEYKEKNVSRIEIFFVEFINVSLLKSEKKTSFYIQYKSLRIAQMDSKDSKMLFEIY